MVPDPSEQWNMPEADRSTQFRALRIHRRDGGVEARFEQLRLEDLSPGELVVRIAHSGINYKDALAATGAGRILRRFPLVGGIDLAGEVESSSDPRFRPGDAVLATGGGLSETRDGGYSQRARVPAELAIPLPAGFDTATAMAIGTAGVSAAAAIMRMEHNGQGPARGPVLVTGATGGVGSIAVDLLAARGYEVVALTGKREAGPYLSALGAATVLFRDDVSFGKAALESTRWGGGIDSVGGETLSWLLRTTMERGNVASVGLAASAALELTVMPFILRGVSLLGISNAASARSERLDIWARLAGEMRPRHLDRIVTRTITLEQLPEAFGQYLAGRVTGRTLVRVE
jgi:acrylyl-CoA reductase (NADPH)